MADKTFDEIMETIAMGLTSDASHDVAYLREQMEVYKDHPLSKEILRACGRLLWDALPEEKKAELTNMMDNHRDSAQAVIDEATFNMKQGNPAKALQLIEPLAQKYDELIASGWNKDDTESVYFDFSTAIEGYVWRAHNDEQRSIRPASEPYATVYFMYGSALYEAGRFEEALAALQKAIRWNPANPILRFELGENYKRLGDMDAYERILNETHPYLATTQDMARFHRSKGFLLIERAQYELAAAHLMFSLAYEHSQVALSEVMYIKMARGEDYTGMTPKDALNVLDRTGELDLALPDRKTINAMAQYMFEMIDRGEIEESAKVAGEIYQLTGDDRVGELAKKLTEALSEGDKQ